MKWTDSQKAELANLFHLARIALAAKGSPSRYDMKCWAADEYHKAHPSVSSCAAYKELCRQGSWRYV